MFDYPSSGVSLKDLLSKALFFPLLLVHRNKNQNTREKHCFLINKQTLETSLLKVPFSQGAIFLDWT